MPSLLYTQTMHVRALNSEDVFHIAQWKYEQELALYSQEEITGDTSQYFAVEDGGALFGFGVVGKEAQVNGQAFKEVLLDFGLAMNPAYVRKGLGSKFAIAVFAKATELALGSGFIGLRCAILDWNIPSQRIAISLGFRESGVITNEIGRFLEYEYAFRSSN